MQVVPIASDSLGVRSMCTQVITDDVKILIDPSVAIAPKRFGRPPHAMEINRMNELWEKILGLSKESDILIITHYHLDHYSLDEPSQFKDKLLYIKHPFENINFSQRTRAWNFLKTIKDIPKKIEHSDGKEVKFGNTLLKFSKAVYHGNSNKLGYITEVFIQEGKDKFLYTSDTEGPCVEDQMNFILENKPNIIFCDGPLSYLLGWKFSDEDLKKSIENMKKIISEVKPKIFIIDHHLLREGKWKETIKEVLELAEKKGTKIQTVAEFLGKPIDQLEVRRAKLFKEFPNMEATPKKTFTGE